MGERTPHLDPNARAAFLGLSASHSRAHMTRAILEGVAYSLKDTFAIFDDIGVPVQHIRLGGGGARSPLWRQIQADVYGHEVELVEAEEGSAFGAAILAGVAAKWWTNVDEACEAVVRIASTTTPAEHVSLSTRPTICAIQKCKLLFAHSKVSGQSSLPERKAIDTMSLKCDIPSDSDP
jgi:xylulokinase